MAFARNHRTLFVGLTAVTGCALVAAAVVAPAASAGAARSDASSHSTLAELTASGASAGSAAPELLTAPPGRPVERPKGLAASASDATVARAHLQGVAARLGVDPGASSLRAVRTSELAGDGSVVRFAQLVDGVPVYGAELVVALDDSGDLLSVGGSTVPETDLSFPVTPARATAVARAAAAKKLNLDGPRLTASTPRRLAYDPALIGDAGSGVRSVWRVVVTGPRGTAAYAEVFVDATDGSVVSIGGGVEAINRAVCDAETAGNVSSPSEDDAWQSDAAYIWCGASGEAVVRDTTNDGYVIDEATRAAEGLPFGWVDDTQDVDVPYSRVEGGAVRGGDVDKLYTTFNNVSEFYRVALGTDLTARIGTSEAILGVPGGSTVRALGGVANYCNPAEYYYNEFVYYGYVPDNWHARASTRAAQACTNAELQAFWADVDYDWMPSDGAYPGGQLVVSKGLGGIDDVLGHELTHGVTASTNGLIYRNESGAINESMSDVFGQLVQEYNDDFTDSEWLVGDKLAIPTRTGALRSMGNPSRTDLVGNDDGQPDSMTSSRWDTDPSDSDSGGVHANSGVGNKAAWLIAHGGTFNGYTVRKLDQSSAADSVAATTKVAKLYWRTQQLLPSNANYRTLGSILVSACNQLVGSDGFTAADCNGSVVPAVLATGMTISSTSMSVSRTSVKPGQSVVVTARVSDARGASVGSVGVKLQKLVGGTSRWVDATGVSATAGSVKTWTVKPDRTTSYRAQYPAGGAFRGSTSAPRAVALTPTVSKKLSAKKIKYKKTFKVTGKVAPKLSGKTVYLQRYSSGKWRTVKKDKLSSKSVYSLKYKPTSRADRKFRVYLPKSSSYRSAVSSKFKVTVK